MQKNMTIFVVSRHDNQQPKNPVVSDPSPGLLQETWLKYQTDSYKKAWPKPDYMAEPRSTVYVRDGGEGSLELIQDGELISRKIPARSG